MAFGRRTDMDDDGTIVSTTAAPPAKSNEPGGLTAFIDQGSSFEGKLSFKDTVRIDGHFAGEITSENTLVVGESGEIEANVKSQTVIVSGTLTGDVVAGRKVVLHKTARMQGNVETPCFVMEEGAVINGQIKMAGAAAASKPQALKAVSTDTPKNQ